MKHKMINTDEALIVREVHYGKVPAEKCECGRILQLSQEEFGLLTYRCYHCGNFIRKPKEDLS